MTIVLVALWGMAACAWADMPGNLLANGDFEALDVNKGPASWGTRDWGDRTYASVKVTQGGLFGPKQLQIEGLSRPIVFGCFSQPVNLSSPPATQYLLSLHYRTLGSPEADLSATTFTQDFAQKEWNTPALSSEAVLLENSTRWTSISWSVSCPASVRQMVIMLRIHGAGTLFVDGVSLRAYPTDVQCDIVAPGLVTDLREGRQCRLNLTNRTETALPVQISLETQAEKRPTGRSGLKLTLPARTSKPVSLPYRMPLSTPSRLKLTITGASPDVVYESRTVPVPGLLDGRLISPAFRGTIMSTISGGEVLARGKVNALPELISRLQLQGKLIGTGATSPLIKPDADGSWQLSLPQMGLLAGAYALQVVATAGGAAVGQVDFPVTRVEAHTSEVGYDDRLRLQANSQPFFPIGMFYALEEEDFKAAAEAGCNCLVLPSRLAGTSQVELAARYGLKVIISSASMEDTFWKNVAEKYATRPELLGWYVVQRPASQVPPIPPALLTDLYKRLRDHDPTHPIILAEASVSLLNPYISSCDVLMPWTEPEPAGDLRSVDTLLLQAAAVTEGRKPFWPVIQMTGAAYSDDARLDPAGEGRLPTPAEYRCMVYLALTRGAKGIFNFAYGLVPSQGGRAFAVQRDAPQVWEMVKQVGKELRALSPVLLDGQQLPITCESPGSTAVRALKHQGVTYVFAVNYGSQPASLSWKVPDLAAERVASAFGTAPLTRGAQGNFTELLEPYAVRLYYAQ